jgi:hypothetical protein
VQTAEGEGEKKRKKGTFLGIVFTNYTISVTLIEQFKGEEV